VMWKRKIAAGAIEVMRAVCAYQTWCSQTGAGGRTRLAARAVAVLGGLVHDMACQYSRRGWQFTDADQSQSVPRGDDGTIIDWPYTSRR
jgi:hypothetical protein